MNLGRRLEARPRIGLSPALDAARDRVAREAASRVESGMRVGLGTGDTARRFTECLARRYHTEKLELICVVTSESTALRARELELPVRPLPEVGELDFAADGADEVDHARNLIKGAGGAHTREKIVAASATRFVVLVDETKLVDRLGTQFPVPVEALAEAVPLVMRRIRALGGEPVLRAAPSGGGDWVTDLGNRILDARFPGIDDPKALEAALNGIPGVVENGLFIGMATLVLIGLVGSEAVRRLE